MKRLSDLMGDLQPPQGRGAEPDGPNKNEPRISLPEEDVCPICKGRGFVVLDVPSGHPDFGKLIACRCTEARIALNRSRELHGLSNLGGLDRMTFDTFLPDGVSLPESVRAALHRAFDLSLDFAKRPRGWLVLLGGFGAGKTHLAAAITNYNIDLGRPAIFVVVPDLLDHLRAAFGPSSESGLDERLDAIRETPLLVLDDLGAHHSTPWAQEKLFQILNHRYNSRLPTVITTNQRLEELDPRVASRLADLDLSQIFEIPAPDYRQGGGGGGVLDRGARNLSSLGLHADQTFDNFSLRRHEEMDAARKDNLARAVHEARSFAERRGGLARAQWDVRLRQDPPRRCNREFPGGGRPAHAHVRRRARPARPFACHLQPYSRRDPRPRLRTGQIGATPGARRSGHRKRDAVGP